jgi:hypothetical protein
MGKLFKLVVVAAFAACLLYAGSYAGARASVGKFMGTPLPDMGARTIELNLKGVPDLPTQPRAWEFGFSKASVNANRPAKVYVSLDGKIIATVPRDLAQRLEAWRRSRENP